MSSKSKVFDNLVENIKKEILDEEKRTFISDEVKPVYKKEFPTIEEEISVLFQFNEVQAKLEYEIQRAKVHNKEIDYFIVTPEAFQKIVNYAKLMNEEVPDNPKELYYKDYKIIKGE